MSFEMQPPVLTMHGTTSSATLSLSSKDEWAKDGSIDPVSSAAPTKVNPFAGKGRDFWLTFGALLASCFLSALDLTGVSTVLPTSQSDLRTLLQLRATNP